MAGVFVILLVLVAFGAGLIILQVFLSKRQGKWPGLILPICGLVISLSVVLGIVLFSAATVTTTLEDSDGTVIVEEIGQINSASAIIATAAYMFLFCNIPTAVFVVIYKVCRGSQSRRLELDKMNAQDLE